VVPLQADAHIVLRQVVAVSQYAAAGAAEKDRDIQRARYRFHVLTGRHSGKEHRIDTGGLIGAPAGDRIFQTVDGCRTRPPGDNQRRILTPLEGRFHLADSFVDRQHPRRPHRAEGLRQVGILNRQCGDAGGLQLLDRPLHVQRVAVAMIGIDEQRQVARAVDPVGLLRELRQCKDKQIRRAEYGERRHRARKHADLETDILGDTRRNWIEDGPRVNADFGLEQGAEFLSAGCPVHRQAPSFQLPIADMPARPDQAIPIIVSDHACCAAVPALYQCPRLAGLAQLVEHLICNQGVRGSNPLAGTNFFNGLGVFH
jgi:hypothetical protein